MRLLLTLSYDGSNYQGWVKQPHGKSVQDALETGIKRLIKTTEFHLLGASKTDAGVHALGQRVVLDLNFQVENLPSFQRGLNRTLPADLRVLAIEAILDENFQVRQTKRKVYRYTFDDGNYDVFTQRYVTFSPVKIDEVKLNELLQHFVGTFEFWAFSGLSQIERTQIKTLRTIEKIHVSRTGSKVIVEINGPSFLRYQIRLIIGYCYYMLTHLQKFQLAELEKLLHHPGDLKPGYLAKPNGLTLISISY